jgi:uroporphyrinogen-III synthase
MVITLTKLPPNAQALSLTLLASGADTDKTPASNFTALIAMAHTGGIAEKAVFNSCNGVPGFNSFNTALIFKPYLCQAISMHQIKPNLLMRDWTVLSLRPHGQHAVAHCASQLRGIKFLACSSMKLEAIKNDEQLKAALMCNHIIVTSPAAARFAGKSPVFTVIPNSHWLALGEGTASVLRKLGISNISIPDDGSHSESLLAMAALQNLQGKTIGLITAPGGRGLIEPALINRGAQVQAAFMYQRKIIPIALEQIQAMHNLPIPFAILCSSHEVFKSFWQQIDDPLKEKMRSGLWIISSTRLQTLLQQSGVLSTSISASPQPDAMLEHLVHVQTQQVR